MGVLNGFGVDVEVSDELYECMMDVMLEWIWDKMLLVWV